MTPDEMPGTWKNIRADFSMFRGDFHPAPEIISALHEQSHEECFIARSVRMEVTIEIQ